MIQPSDIYTCPDCGSPMDIGQLRPFSLAQCPTCKSLHRVHTRLGVYEITDKLGVGGMSIVFRATDMVLGREVALKILNETYYDKPERVARFEKESALMAKVHHPNVVNIYSIGQALNHLYIAMELISGTDIETMIGQRGQIPEAETLDIALQVAEGLQAAQKAGLLHRDMKPANILITPKGQAKIVDFGLALLQSDQDTEKEIWVTPFYAPPETLNRSKEDFRSDIYALGVTMFHMLVGKPPIASGINSVRKLLEIKKKLPKIQQLAPELSKATCDLVNRMMAFSMARRPQSYQALIDDINEARAICDAQANGDRKSMRSLYFRRYKRKQSKYLLLGGIALVLIILTVILLLPGRNPEPAAPKTPATSSAPTVHHQETPLNAPETALLYGDFGKAAKAYEEVFLNNQDDTALSAWCALNACLCKWISGPGNNLQEGLDLLQQLETVPLIRQSDRESTRYIITLRDSLLDKNWLQKTAKMPGTDRLKLRAAASLAIGLRHLNSKHLEQALRSLKDAQQAYTEDSEPPYKGYLKPIGLCIADLENFEKFRTMPETSATERKQKIQKGNELAQNQNNRYFQSPYRDHLVNLLHDECTRLATAGKPSAEQETGMQEGGYRSTLKKGSAQLDKNRFRQASNLFYADRDNFSDLSAEYKALSTYATAAEIADTYLRATSKRLAASALPSSYPVTDRKGKKYTITGYADNRLTADNDQGEPATLDWSDLSDESLIHLFKAVMQDKPGIDSDNSRKRHQAQVAQAADEFLAILQLLRNTGKTATMPILPAQSSQLFQSIWNEWKPTLH
ncbi:serine/threonine protein kinase [Akkermansia glycaniphila]|uniref:serine/threonine-protein kinase n=1 Tax=Akkermansia glycaniphila TaxID=1679444 RepID=UPI001C00E545|nr:serine/threonine-protein kinase [Akkermansia glycaniphila]MBT9450163.1 serine/threonine protein kinase [Akkermansia glycaniphila]